MAGLEDRTNWDKWKHLMQAALPCPFCGGEQIELMADELECFYIECWCADCSTSGPVYQCGDEDSLGRDDYLEAIKLWNNRQ